MSSYYTRDGGDVSLHKGHRVVVVVCAEPETDVPISENVEASVHSDAIVWVLWIVVQGPSDFVQVCRIYPHEKSIPLHSSITSQIFGISYKRDKKIVYETEILI